jgi:hypothetical protein
MRKGMYAAMKWNDKYNKWQVQQTQGEMTLIFTSCMKLQKKLKFDKKGEKKQTKIVVQVPHELVWVVKSPVETPKGWVGDWSLIHLMNKVRTAAEKDITINLYDKQNLAAMKSLGMMQNNNNNVNIIV